jgi:hypothetical protein
MPFIGSAQEFDPFVPPDGPQYTSSFPNYARPERWKLGREEVEETFYKDGEIFTIYHRDKVVPEDWVLSSVKATLYARRRKEAYRGTPPCEEYRTALLFADRVI